jgi:hypothetical protein
MALTMLLVRLKPNPPFSCKPMSTSTRLTSTFSAPLLILSSRMPLRSWIISSRMVSTVLWMLRRLRVRPVSLANTVVHVGNRSGMLKPLDSPTTALVAARNSGAFFRFFPNAARDTMLLVMLWNITLRFTGVDGPAARISSTRSATCMMQVPAWSSVSGCK